MKTGEIIEPAFIAKLLDAHLVFDKQFAGMSHAYFDQELRIGFSGSRFEIAAERIRADVGHARNFFQLNGPLEILQAVFIDGIDTVFFIFYQVVAETDR